MTNVFLKINKDLFKLKLEPVEILILAQVMEYNTNTGDCFISNETLAEQFGTSTSTIDRKIKSLVNRGFITRDTKNVKGGKVRHMKVNLKNIEAALTNLNLTLVDSNNDSTNSKMMIDKPQNDTCSNLNLTLDKPQNDVIKDNIKYNIKEKDKDNTGIDACASIPANQPKEIEIDGIKARQMTTDEATEQFGWESCMNRIPTAIPRVFWINKELIQIL